MSDRGHVDNTQFLPEKSFSREKPWQTHGSTDKFGMIFGMSSTFE